MDWNHQAKITSPLLRPESASPLLLLLASEVAAVVIIIVVCLSIRFTSLSSLLSPQKIYIVYVYDNEWAMKTHTHTSLTRIHCKETKYSEEWNLDEKKKKRYYTSIAKILALLKTNSNLKLEQQKTFDFNEEEK